MPRLVSLSVYSYIRDSWPGPHSHVEIMVTVIAWALSVVGLRVRKKVEKHLCSEQGMDWFNAVQWRSGG